MNTKQLAIRILPAAATLLIPAVSFAAGGNPIQDSAQSALDIGVNLGPLVCGAGVLGVCAGGLMRSMGLLGGSAVVAVCGGGWSGAPQIAEKLSGAAAGFGLSDLIADPSFLQTATNIIGLS